MLIIYDLESDGSKEERRKEIYVVEDWGVATITEGKLFVDL